MFAFLEESNGIQVTCLEFLSTYTISFTQSQNEYKTFLNYGHHFTKDAPREYSRLLTEVIKKSIVQPNYIDGYMEAVGEILIYTY